MTPSQIRRKCGVKPHAAGSKITPKEAKAIYKVYQEVGSYAKTAKICGRSAGVVATHCKVFQQKEEMGVY